MTNSESSLSLTEQHETHSVNLYEVLVTLAEMRLGGVVAFSDAQWEKENRQHLDALLDAISFWKVLRAEHHKSSAEIILDLFRAEIQRRLDELPPDDISSSASTRTGYEEVMLFASDREKCNSFYEETLRWSNPAYVPS